LASASLLTASVFAIGCGPVVDGQDGGDDDSSGTDGTATTATTATTASTTVGPTTTSADTTATTSMTTSPPNPIEPTSASTVTVTTDPSDTSDPTGEGLPDGSACDDGLQCASGACYVIPVLGGICGQCESDADCEGGGCTLPNPLAFPPTPSACNAGAYGAGCESDAACADGLLCADAIDVPGIVTVSTCSECRDSGDCAMGWTCEPDLAIAALTGVLRCVAPGTLANGQTCDLAGGGGDIACGSGHCEAADVMGVLQVGVCSACGSDADCGDASVCIPPEVSLDGGAVPGACSPA
jgi:hypothetical protein